MLLKLLKRVVSLPYQLLHAVRELFYSLGICRKNKLKAYVISIGNFSFGGVGKTPLTIELAKYLAESFNVAILTRGYKSKYKNTKAVLIKLGLGDTFEEKIQIISEHKAAILNQANLLEYIGDEACLMLEHLHGTNVSMGVYADRYAAGSELLEKEPIDIFILDDGMQHIHLERDMEILVKNINESGFYREFPCLAEAKADFIIHSKVDELWLKQNPGQISMRYKIKLSRDLDPNKGVLALTAIADPETYFNELRRNLSEGAIGGKTLAQQGFLTKSYPDHHSFSLDEVTGLLSLGMNLICTEKDFVKISEEYKSSFIVAQLSLEFEPNGILESIKGRMNP